MLTQEKPMMNVAISTIRSFKSAAELCRQAIEQEEKSFFVQGMCLYKIREEGWWQNKYETFNACCKTEFGRGENWAYKQIKAYEVVADVNGLEIEFVNEVGEADCTIVQIENEAQARELSRLDSMQDRANVISAAAKTAKLKDGKPVITAAAIRKAAAESNGPPKKKKPAPKKPAEEVTGQQWCKYQVEQVKSQIKGMDVWRKKHQVDNENWAKVDEHLSCLYDAFKALGRFKS